MRGKWFREERRDWRVKLFDVDWEYYIGSDLGDLAAWQEFGRLCSIIPIPETIPGCMEVRYFISPMRQQHTDVCRYFQKYWSTSTTCSTRSVIAQQSRSSTPSRSSANTLSPAANTLSTRLRKILSCPSSSKISGATSRLGCCNGVEIYSRSSSGAGQSF
jgi:hypothetical protein